MRHLWPWPTYKQHRPIIWRLQQLHAAVRHSNSACWASGHPHSAACGWRWWSIYMYFYDFYYSRQSRVLLVYQSVNQSTDYSLPSDSMNRNHIKTDKICICITPMQFTKAQYTPPTPTRLNSIVGTCVASAVCIGHNRLRFSMPMLPYTATTTTLSQHLVPRDSESPAVPSKFHNLGDSKKNFGADPVPLKLWTKSPPLDVSVNELIPRVIVV